jgi:Trypsin-like peptidase domain/Tetratricopeptide repeat
MSLENLLQQCTVKLSISGYMGWGTGFFVAPELILTCAHVVEKASIEDSIQVRWKNEEKWAQAFIERLLPNPYDLALLRVSQLGSRTHPCISFDREKIRSRDQLYLFGYPANDFPNGCPVTCDSEGLTMDEPSFIKFKAGQIQPGMSGSPLLNQRTGDVCGIVKFTLGSNSDAGGGATQSTTILAQFPELIEKQMLFHQQDRRWNNLVGELFDDEKVMTQNNSDDTTVYQTKTGANNTNYIGGVHHHNSDSLKVEQTVKKILMLAANPDNIESSRKRTGIKEIRNALNRAKAYHGQLFDLEDRLETSAIDISQELSAIQPYIINISGCENGIGMVTLKSNYDGSTIVNPDILIADLFKYYANNVECVVLNGCYSKEQSVEIAQYIKYVIGINHLIDDREAVIFLNEFYYQLGSKRGIKNSYDISCNLLQRSGDIDSSGIPVLLNKKDETDRRNTEQKLKACILELEEKQYSIELWNRKAELLERLGRYTEATESYEKASDLQPDNPKYRTNQGDLLEKAGNYEQAVIAYNKALEIEEDDYQVWWKKGQALIGIKKYNEAAISYDRAVSLKPPSPDGYVILREYGSLQKKLGNYNKSIILYKKSLSLEPKYRISSYEKRQVYKKMYSECY